MLEAFNLSVFRGERLVLRDVSLRLESGQAILLRAPNGSGKSTLLRALAGLTPLAGGRLLWAGAPAFDDMPAHAARIGWLGHLDAVKPALNVGEHAPAAALAAVGLAGFAALPARLLSAGQKRRLAIARVLAANRPLWLLDEPTTGLDTAAVAQFEALCSAHLAAGGMLVASTHLELNISAAAVLTL
jgi:heme exporter protein A